MVDISRYYKQTESSKILDEVSSQSAYQKDIGNYYSVGYSEGFIACMTYMDKEQREEAIQELKKLYDKDKETGESKSLEYILRLYNDKFKVLEIK